MEGDLPPIEFSNLLSYCDSNYVTANYDIGNSAFMGYNPLKELEAYGNKISDIHIKDRKLGGNSVILGKGDADFKSFFSMLKEYEYRGPFIMQAYRDDDGIGVFKSQFDWINFFVSSLICQRQIQ